MSITAIAWYVIISKLLILLVWGDGDESLFMYKPYNITFNDTGFRWREGGYYINIPEYDVLVYIVVALPGHRNQVRSENFISGG